MKKKYSRLIVTCVIILQAVALVWTMFLLHQRGSEAVVTRVVYAKPQLEGIKGNRDDSTGRNALQRHHNVKPFRYKQNSSDAKEHPKNCRIGVISTWPPAKCGIAEFTKDFVGALKELPEFQQGDMEEEIDLRCTLEVIPIVTTRDSVANYAQLRQEGRMLIVDDKTLPFEQFYLQVLPYIQQQQFSHVILQQELGLTSIMWQMDDMARWLAPMVQVITVIHTPSAYPNVEVTGLLRQLAHHSDLLVVMSWHAVYSLVHGYGIDRSKIRFIPHGVEMPLPQLTPLNSFTPQDTLQRGIPPEIQDRTNLVVLSFGLIHSQKGLRRLVRIMPDILRSVPNFYFVIAGMEHPMSSEKVMPRLLREALRLGIDRRHIVWINQYLSHDEVQWLHRRADIIVSLYDEVTPTSGTLLKAMSYGRAIVATQYRFAVEVLGGYEDDEESRRGELVPFEQDDVTLQRMLRLLLSPKRREALGAKAKLFVQQWNWKSVASVYVDAIRRRPSNQTARRPLTEDPFAGMDTTLAVLEPSEALQWSPNSIQLFDRPVTKLELRNPALLSHVLYVDHVLQINVRLQKSEATFVIRSVSVETPSFAALVNAGGAMPDIQFKPNTELTKEELVTVVSNPLRLYVQSANVHFYVEVPTDTTSPISHAQFLTIVFERVNRFAAPFGIVGDAIRRRYDLIRHTQEGDMPLALDHTSHDDNGDTMGLFAHDFPCQQWAMFGVDVNIYRAASRDFAKGLFSNRPVLSPHQKSFTIEGPIFNLESFALVNRQLLWQLHWAPFVTVLLKPTDVFTNLMLEDLAYSSVEGSFVVGVYRVQKSMTVPIPGVADFYFRNAWPPKFDHPRPSAIYIHQQPWEFTSIPTSWVAPMNKAAAEVWVPSLFCKNIYIANGVQREKVHVVPHGIDWKKTEMESRALSIATTESSRLQLLGTSKPFVFLFIGGLLPRKGIDVLLKAYVRAFPPRYSDVSLMIHSIYGDHFQRAAIERLAGGSFGGGRFRLTAEVVFHEKPWTHAEYVRVLHSVQGFVSPFRSEGFGLTILEAMAAGLPPIIPYFGPPIEFAPNETAVYFHSSLADCKRKPCGKISMFDEPTVFQAQWGEPSVEDLAAKMKQVYEEWSGNSQQRKTRAILAKSAASKQTWDRVGLRMIERLEALSAGRRS